MSIRQDSQSAGKLGDGRLRLLRATWFVVSLPALKLARLCALACGATAMSLVCGFTACVAAQTKSEAPTSAATQLLVNMTNHVRDEDLDVRALVVLHQGQVRLEWHSGLSSPAHSQQIFSCTKSVVSALLGIAMQQQSQLTLDSQLGEVFPHLQQLLDANTSADISVKQLLQMRSGLPSTRASSRRFFQLHNAPDRLRWALALRPNARPGELFRYGNAEPQILLSIVGKLSGEDVREFAQRALFRPLGFENHHWQYPDASGMVAGGYGLRLRAIDMARFGELFLRGGYSNGQQLLSNQWVAASTMTAASAHYGFMWWNHVAASGYRSFAALGLYGQVIQVVPDLDLVFVMAANLARSQSKVVRRRLLERYVIPAILAYRGPTPHADLAALRAVRQQGTHYVPSNVSAGSKRNLPRP